LITFWQYQVNSVVPGPYLDEVFHVRQAQAYWAHRWRQWDPKITTPPGLYLSSYLIGVVLAPLSPRPVDPTASDMRSLNSVVLFNLLPFRLRKLLSHIRKAPNQPRFLPDKQAQSAGGGMWELNLTVLNICLFPPIFFFSGLYYTDLAALLIVLEVYICDLGRCRNDNGRMENTGSKKLGSYIIKQLSFRDLSFLIGGLLALLFRQTNIFWVALFMGGLQIIRTLHCSTVDCQSPNLLGIARASWELRQLYDPPASEASFEGIAI
jgi:alpha-1,2-glucosyltransferase